MSDESSVDLERLRILDAIEACDAAEPMTEGQKAALARWMEREIVQERQRGVRLRARGEAWTSYPANGAPARAARHEETAGLSKPSRPTQPCPVEALAARYDVEVLEYPASAWPFPTKPDPERELIEARIATRKAISGRS